MCFLIILSNRNVFLFLSYNIIMSIRKQPYYLVQCIYSMFTLCFFYLYFYIYYFGAFVLHVYKITMFFVNKKHETKIFHDFILQGKPPKYRKDIFETPYCKGDLQLTELKDFDNLMKLSCISRIKAFKWLMDHLSQISDRI